MMNQGTHIPTLTTYPGMAYVPIPPSEAALPSVEAQPWLRVFDSPSDLEGLHFNRDGSELYFVHCRDNLVCKVDMKTKDISVVLELNRYIPDYAVSAVKVHRDGRLFVACVNADFTDGGILFINPDGSGVTRVAEHLVADDMAFDRRGGIYATDMRGRPTNETGAIFYISSDFSERYTVFKNIAAPNGITLSTDERVLWITDILNGNIIRTELTEDGLRPGRIGQCVVYRTTGYLGPDSLMVDNDDNVYCAMYGQGRVLVFNSWGWPIGQVLMPRRDEGYHLATTHPMIRPGTRELNICTNDGRYGAGIFRAGSFAVANTKAFYLQ